MYGYAMQPPMGPYMPWWPPQNNPAPQDPFAQINSTINWLEGLKKNLKDNDKDKDKKDDPKKKGPPPSEVVAMMLFMILMSPIIGPIVYTFYGMTKGLLK